MTQTLFDSVVRNQVYLEGLKADQVNKFTTFLKRIDKDLRERLTRDDLTTFSRTRLERLLGSVDKNLNHVFTSFQSEFEKELVEIGDYEAEFETKAITNLADGDPGFEMVIPSSNQVKAAIFSTPLSVKGADGGKLLTPFIKDWSATDRKRITGIIRQGFFEGQTNFQIIQALRGTKARNFQDGALAIVARNAEAIVRTSVQHVASVSRFETWNQNQNVVQGYKWVSTLDSKTTTVCRSLDGGVYKLGEGPKPPAHIRCRSTTIAKLDSKYDFLDKGRTRSTHKGPVDAKKSYYDWLKDQPVEFQDDVLGPLRGKLFRDGGLTVERFRELQLDKRFRPLTLAELKKKEPLAFKRAFGDVETPKPARQSFTPLSSVKEVKHWLESNRFATHVDFGKIDVSVANEMAESWVYHVSRFPKLKSNMGFMGSIQVQNKIVYDRSYARYLEQAKQHYPGHDPHEIAKRWTKRRKTNPLVWAHAVSKSNNGVFKNLHGICFNEKYAIKKGLSNFYNQLKQTVHTQFHPVGCDTVKSVMDHEVGHQLDYLLDLSKDQTVVKMWKDWGRDKTTLSGYAGENIAEFIAEAWAEYLNNPSPRPVAKQLGEFIEKVYDQRFKEI